MHRTLEQCEQEALRDGRDHSTADDAHVCLDALWPESGFPDDNVGMAWRARATRIIDALYARWPSSRVAVALERPLLAVIDGVPWMGRADRIEHGDGSLEVVDYKTSATATTRDEAAESLQLGYYVWAAMHDDALSHWGPITGASFWYPAASPRKESIATRSFDMHQLPAVIQRLEDVTAGIRAEEFPATPNKDCGRCPVASTCPAFPAGSEAFAP